MPVFDAIQFRALGVVGQPAIDWQNRPTFQQVVEFYRAPRRGRPRAGRSVGASSLRATPGAAVRP